jgi:DNA-binding phage protein
MTPFGAKDIEAFYNPYESQVIEGALGDIERSRLMQDIADRARATQARAFGGSRQGVQAALTNEAALRNASTTASGLRQAGFNTAANLGLTARSTNMAGLTTSLGLGAQRDALRQAELDAARNLELERLGITSGALGLQPANTGGTSTQPLYTSTAGSILSGGLTGGYIGSILQPKKP